MRTYKVLNINGAILNKNQLEKYLQKLATDHIIKRKSDKQTYPVPRMIENFEEIKETYNLLSEHVKLGINIHPAGEWLLDNFYIVEETVKSIKKELTLNKYVNFVGIQKGYGKGFARIYVLANEIIAHTDNRVERHDLEAYLQSYQTKKTLSMDEIWNIGIFLQISIIENIREICERIYVAQLQKYKVSNIIERLVDNKPKSDMIYPQKISLSNEEKILNDSKYPFIEYMSYSLKRHGKKADSFLRILEDEVDKTGNTISDIIKKEHFDIALRKVSIGNCITSIKTIQRIDFLDIFEKINGVEEVLKSDPAGIYEKMDYKTKEEYRNKIKEISNKAKVSEIYVAKKILKICSGKKGKESHIGYYIIDSGITQLYKELEIKNKSNLSDETKSKIYVSSICIISVITSGCLAKIFSFNNTILFIINLLILLIPISEVVIQLIQYFLSKVVKPKIIPKMDFYDGVDSQNSTIVVIPTIIKTKEKVQELMKKLEVFYIANKSDNLYFALLGDCSESKSKEEEFDFEVIGEGKKQVERLNNKYCNNEKFKIFNFIYRERKWNDKEGSYLGWERKRGLLTQFNEYILGNIKNPFRENTIEKNKLPPIKYVITLDSDTDLILNSAFELIGAMAHPLNKPIINEQNVVVGGHAIIQPRVGINMNISSTNLFTKIFAGSGGIDSYTNAISDIYQDNFGEGIFTGKGIYDVEVFSKVLRKAIPENTVLSHDLLEGCYLRCGLATDILLMDGYPTKYMSFMTRLSRWIRGDWQIIDWLGNKINVDERKVKNPLNFLSKYKICDNLRRSLLEINIVISLIYFYFICQLEKCNETGIFTLLIAIAVFPFILEIFNFLIGKREGEEGKKTFYPKIGGFKGAVYRGIITLGCIPYKAYCSLCSILKTVYRKLYTHKNLLEWTTSEEAEKQCKDDLKQYYKNMYINVVLGLLLIFSSFLKNNLLNLFIGGLWIVTPYIMFKISLKQKVELKVNEISKDEKEYIYEIGKKTWEFFKDYITEENNYLIPDNYQEGRLPLIVDRTSSTNIGLSILAIISSYDLKYENLENTIDLIDKLMKTIDELPKWNGHLYNWYNIKTKEPLIPRYISTVDSGNFIGYMYVVNEFINECMTKENVDKEQLNNIKNIIDNVIRNTDFSMLYNSEHKLFSIGFNIEENKLTDSYYDLLASEARQASLIAIAKKDVPSKHWNALSRTLTTVNKYKGLVSWSGTAFEYLMPNINIRRYEGSLLDESSKFLLMSQIEYCRRLGIPWGISESAFNLKDLHSNYQYKAFGIPWLGLKRGLADEFVVSSYGSILAITDIPKRVVENIKVLDSEGMLDKYGFYEAIDYTPSRLEKNRKNAIVKTYMAHHQGLILLSINNFFNNNIFPKRFSANPEIEAVEILLQERMPDSTIISKDNKHKLEKLKYKDYENYSIREYNKVDDSFVRGNVIANENYTIAMDQRGRGVSKYNDIYINRYKKTDDYSQGIFFYIKNIKSKRTWSSNYSSFIAKPDKYKVSFMPDKDRIERIDENIQSKIEVTVASNKSVEIRRLELKNLGNQEEILEVSSFFEPVISKKEQDYSHPAFNNLFLVYDYNEETKNLLVKRKKRGKNEKEIYLATQLYTECDTIGDYEFEIDKEKFFGRGNFEIPKMIKKSLPFSKSLGLVTEPIVAMKRNIKLKPNEKVYIDLIISVNYDKEEAVNNLNKYKSEENIKREFELSKAKVEAESRYLEIKGKEIDVFQKMLSYIIFRNPLKKSYIKNLPEVNYKQSDLWKYGISGDLPIILVKIKDVNDIYVINQILKAYEFFNTRNVSCEIVIMDEERHSYDNYVREEIESAILNHHLAYMINRYGGIFVLSKNEIEKRDLETIEFVSNIIIDCHKGSLDVILNDLEEECVDNYKEVNQEKGIIEISENNEDIDILKSIDKVKYYNEYGGFSENGKEYLIKVNKDNRTPTVWSHIMANKKFGTVITESGGGYSWYENSRLNRITAWNNSASFDIPSEVIYIKDEDSKKSWSLCCGPKPDNKNYNIIYGFGYAKYIHASSGIIQELKVFVPKEDSAKVSVLNLRNTTPNKKNLKLVYYLKPVLAEDELKSNEYIKLDYDANTNSIIAKNLYNDEFKNNVVVISSSEKVTSYTGDKQYFLGSGGISNPDGLKRIQLNNDLGIGKNSCIAVQINISLDSFSEKEISIVLGVEESIIKAKDIAYKYSKTSKCKEELNDVISYWNELFSKLKVETPVESVNLMLNGWSIYQTITSRLLGKSGFYQSGGAYGFRDQLQDTLALKYIKPEMLKNQIILHSRHQFLEGDVEHWWHEEIGRGIRTRFSDDLLWLVFLTIEYIDCTDDKSILELKTNYLTGKLLEENEDEKYDHFIESDVSGSIYEHCIKAIDKSLNFGENGLPKIGTGDWNDGFSEVGNKGKGESVWLGFFLYYVLDKFIPICEYKGDIQLANKYQEVKTKLRKALNTNGWDGRWFKRAFFDDGNILGSMENDECRIDSIAQSWSVISDAGDNDKKYISMESLENHLVDKENGIIKLLDPPFINGKLEPGYIKAYMPGVRENGGQYTHGAIWAIIAEALLGFGDKAFELYRMINPIEHSRTKDTANKYKVEPYVIAADIYGQGNLAGRGGWTWYTGSSSWYYKAGIEYILGLKIKENVMKIEPCISKEWKEYSIQYKFKDSIYNIKVYNPNRKSTGVEKVILNGVEIENNIVLDGSGKIYNIEIVM